MPSQNDFPLVSDWPECLVTIYQLYRTYKDNALTGDWTSYCDALDASDIEALSSNIGEVVTDFIPLLDLHAHLARKPDAEQLDDVRRAFAVVRRRYWEVRHLLDAYSSMCSGHSIDPEDHLGRLWDSPEFAEYDRVRLWLEARTPRRRQYHRDRYRELAKYPDNRAQTADASRRRYYEKSGRPVPETKKPQGRRAVDR